MNSDAESQDFRNNSVVDVHTAAQRSFNMSRIRSQDSKPEMIVRSLVHQLGFRFRLHRRDLPGTPDLVLPRHRLVIFVHGCFWHRHRCRYGKVRSATRSEFWEHKLQGNAQRDRRNQAALKAAGWKVVVIWECWTRDPQGRLLAELQKTLSVPVE